MTETEQILVELLDEGVPGVGTRDGEAASQRPLGTVAFVAGGPDLGPYPRGVNADGPTSSPSRRFRLPIAGDTPPITVRGRVICRVFTNGSGDCAQACRSTGSTA
jgi:hypothetical protein